VDSNSPGAVFLQHEFLVGDNRNWEQRMSSDKSIQVVLKFEDLINGRDADAIVSHMTGAAEFIDSLGNSIRGTEKLRTAWTSYFKIVPDYSISHSEIFADGSTVAVFGSAQGTFSKDGNSPKRISGKLLQPGVPW
jgi:ketosteroid isomerase-like protein